MGKWEKVGIDGVCRFVVKQKIDVCDLREKRKLYVIEKEKEGVNRKELRENCHGAEKS